MFLRILWRMICLIPKDFLLAVSEPLTDISIKKIDEIEPEI